MNTAIIVAAGSGSRFGSDQPKQFIQLAGKPVIVHTLEQFEACPAVDAIVLVLPAAALTEFKVSIAIGHLTKLSAVVAGGRTRTESVRNGLAAAPAETQIVAVHDGARPLVPSEDIARTIAEAERTGAACLVARVNDTVKIILADEISGTLDRDKLRRALTPQVFRIEVLRAAFQQDPGDNPTDECVLVERLGHPIVVVEGSGRNIKITTPDDLIVAEAFLHSKR